MPFHTISIDFILALPVSVPDRYDVALSVTDKFSKAITVIPGQASWSTHRWAVALLPRLHTALWGVPRAIISDRDTLFTSQLWPTIMSELKVEMCLTTAYHPSADGAVELSNQTIEIALRYYCAAIDDHQRWPGVLPQLCATLCNSTSKGTGKTATQILYGQRIREALDLMRVDDDDGNIIELPDEDSGTTVNVRARSAPPTQTTGTVDRGTGTQRRAVSAALCTYWNAVPVVRTFPVNHTSQDVEQLRQQHRTVHVDARDAIALAAMTAKRLHDKTFAAQFFDVGDYVSLRLHRGYTVPGLRERNPKLTQQFGGPFKILERIGKLAYRLELPASMARMHPVVSIAHLEPATAPHADPYHRYAAAAVLPAVDELIPERLLRRRVQRRRNGGRYIQYLVRWIGLGVQHDNWVAKRKLPQQMTDAFDMEHGIAEQLADDNMGRNVDERNNE